MPIHDGCVARRSCSAGVASTPDAEQVEPNVCRNLQVRIITMEPLAIVEGRTARRHLASGVENHQRWFSGSRAPYSRKP